jgi:hypothetical protein
MTEHELSKPLTDAEQLRYTAYHERFKKSISLKRALDELEWQISEANGETATEPEQLLELRKKYRSLMLDIWEIIDCNKLSARRGWPLKLEEYRWQVSFSAFADLSGHFDEVMKEWWGKYNLPTLTGDYERAKQACTTHDARLKLARRKVDHAKKKLVQLEQDDSELIHQLDPSKNLGEVRQTILCEIMGDVFSQFLQHVEKDLIESKQDSTSENSQASEPEEPYDYASIRLMRERDADLHDLNIESLIKAKKYLNWWDMQEKEQPRLIESGNGLQRFYYPKPYSEKYFWRFLYIIANTSFGDVKAELRNQFFGDKVDRDYVQGLLLQAEQECFLTVEGAVVLADDQNLLAFENPHNGWPFGTYPEAIEKLTDSIFFGGEDFKQRAQLAKEWCQEMAAEEQNKQVSNNTPNLDTVQVPDIKATAIQPAANRKTRKAGSRIKEPSLRDSSIKLEKFLSDANVKTEDIDDVAKAAGFWPPTPLAPSGNPLYSNIWVKFAPAKLCAVADALKDFIKARKRTAFILEMSKRYGYPTARIDNTKGDEYTTAKGESDTIVKSIREKLAKNKGN